MSPDTGSAWWAEILMGSACSFTAALLALSHTAIGPFAALTVVYGTIFAVVSLAFAAGLGVLFLSSGIRRSPYTVRPDASEEPVTGSIGAVAGQENDM